MSRCAYVSPKTGMRCPFEATVGSLYCHSCRTVALREQTAFQSWMREVEKALEALCGLHPDDLPDCPYADWQITGMTSEEAARLCLARFLGDNPDA